MANANDTLERISEHLQTIISLLEKEAPVGDVTATAHASQSGSDVTEILRERQRLRQEASKVERQRRENEKIADLVEKLLGVMTPRLPESALALPAASPSMKKAVLAQIDVIYPRTSIFILEAIHRSYLEKAP